MVTRALLAGVALLFADVSARLEPRGAALAVVQAFEEKAVARFVATTGKLLIVDTHFPEAEPPDRRRRFRGRAIAAWFTDTVEKFDIRVNRRVRCNGRCCDFSWPSSRGEIPQYLEQVCVDASGRVVRLRFGN